MKEEYRGGFIGKKDRGKGNYERKVINGVENDASRAGGRGEGMRRPEGKIIVSVLYS